MFDRRHILKGMAAAAIPVTAAISNSALGNSAPPAPSNAPPAPPMPQLSNPWTGRGNIRRAGGTLHYSSIGTPSDHPPIVLLHKLGGWIADWRDVAPLLPQDRQIIAFDMPGHGLSHWDGEPPRVQSVFETAALVVGAIRELKLGTVDLVGTSLGGCVAIAIAALYPDMVRRLALPSCVIGTASSEEDVARKEASQADMFTASGYPLPVDPVFSRDIFGLIDYQRIGLEQDASRHVAGLWIKPQERGVAFTDFPALLRRISAPTLMLYAERDQFFLKYRPVAEANLQNVTCITLAGASGLHVQDNPQETATAIGDFLRA